MEDAVVKNATSTDANEENIDDDTVVDDTDIFNSTIESLQDKMMENEGVYTDNEGVENVRRVTI